MRGETALHHVTDDRRQYLVVTYACSALQQARLHDALRDAAQLLPLEALSDLSLGRVHGELRIPDLIVLSVLPDAARDVVSVVREIRLDYPRSAIVAYCGGVRETPASIGALAAAGVHQFLFSDVNDRGATMRAILENARRQCVAEVVLSALRSYVPPMIQPMIEAALTRPAQVTNVRELADAMGVHRKTLFNRCEQASFVGPAELLTWTRLALVAYLLASTGHSVERISLELGFPSPTALRNTMKRYTGSRPLEVRNAGGLALIVARLEARLHARRSGGWLESNTIGSELHIL